MIEQTPETHTRARPTRPNILVLMTDDHGQWASHCYGNRELSTPNMDYLAETGARMQNAYTPCPVCSPARACSWTGRLPSQHEYPRLGCPGGRRHAGLARSGAAPGVGSAGAGYRTGLAGKWHCGQGEIPGAGFDFALAIPRTSIRIAERSSSRRTASRSRSADGEVRLVTSRALEFLGHRDQERPFFLFVGYVNTHSPFQDHPERLVRRYRDAQFVDIPREKYHGPCKPIQLAAQDEATQRKQLAQYYAAVTYVDEQIGALAGRTGHIRRPGEHTRRLYLGSRPHERSPRTLPKGNATAPQKFLRGVDPRSVPSPVAHAYHAGNCFFRARGPLRSVPDPPRRSRSFGVGRQRETAELARQELSSPARQRGGYALAIRTVL